MLIERQVNSHNSTQAYIIQNIRRMTSVVSTRGMVEHYTLLHPYLYIHVTLKNLSQNLTRSIKFIIEEKNVTEKKMSCIFA